MIYILTDNLREGMVLARDIYSGSSYLPLLTRGKALKASEILGVKSHNIPGVYIENKFSDDVAPQEIVRTTVKRVVMTEIKGLYRNLERRGASDKNFGAMIQVSSQLVSEILTREEVLCNILDLKTYDDYTYSHSMCVGILSALVGVRMGLGKSQLDDLAVSGLLHDVGKTDISLGIINKPAALTPEEFGEIQKHPAVGAQRLAQSHRFSTQVLLGVGAHHERYDGTGYPLGLAGDEIPLFGRILSVVDVYDALTSRRPYRDALYPHDALEYIMAGAGSQFDLDVVNTFTQTVAAYPVGTFVRLSNGTLALVLQNSRENTLRPRVRLVHPPQDAGKEVDLMSDAAYFSVTICGVCSVDDLPEGIM